MVEKKLRLLIPINMIPILRRWYPKMRVVSIEGSGTNLTSSQSFNFELGSIEVALKNRAKLSWLAAGIDHAKTIEEIDNILVDRGITSATISELKYVVDLGSGFDSDFAINCWKCYTPHKGLDLNRVVNGGSFPEMQLYSLLSGIREQLDAKTAKLFRSSVLILTKTEPNQKLIDAPGYIEAITEQFMKKFQFNEKDWVMTNVDFRTTGKLKVE